MALAPASTWASSEAMAMSARRSSSCAPQLRVAVQHRLGEPVGARRPALDQVAGHRERRAGEADERRGAELGDDLAHGLADVGRVDVGLEGAQPVEVGRGAERLGDDRARRPGVTSTPKPMAAAGTTMSLKRMAASTP